MRGVGLFALGLTLACGAVGTACTQQASDGPDPIVWDREQCRGCGMAISEKQFAVEVRGGPKNAVEKFDDVGCALKWLDKQPWGKDPAVRIWVAKAEDGQWLDARKAVFTAGATSPMGFNFGAHEAGREGLTLEQTWNQVRAMGARH